ASTYTYTDAGNLSGALTGATQRTYEFDERGNLKSATVAGAKTTFIVDTNDRLISSTNSSGKTTYVHDAALGRRTSQTLSGTTTTYAYDNASRLTGWSRGADSATYTYDAAGQRTRTVHMQGGKTPVTTTTDYTYDGITLLSLAALQGAATWKVSYLYDEDGRPYAGVYQAGATTVTFLIATNDRGDVVGLTNTSGAWFARYTYDPYGRVLTQTAQAVSGINVTLAGQIRDRQVLRYAGYVYDAHSATYYLAARHYDPAAMRFLTKDPARDDGEESAYQYCAGEPVGKVDPTGLRSQTRRFTLWAWRSLSGPDPSARAMAASALFYEGETLACELTLSWNRSAGSVSWRLEWSRRGNAHRYLPMRAGIDLGYVFSLRVTPRVKLNGSTSWTQVPSTVIQRSGRARKSGVTIRKLGPYYTRNTATSKGRIRHVVAVSVHVGQNSAHRRSTYSVALANPYGSPRAR
ncbi:MAG: RHS repeat-associated core domain-containing protein, partial [Coriobacteriia bacterium]|nr:RHS repeat-associated core domain-containing protein [Coriobacteriia bacterium]